MRKSKRSKTGKRTSKKDILEIDSDSDIDEVTGGRMLALCCGGEVNASSELLNTTVKKDVIEIIDLDSDKDEGSGRMLALCCGEMNAERLETDSMQIVCGDGFGLEYDLEYKKFLLEDSVRDSSQLLLTYNVENEVTNGTKGRAVKSKKKSREKSSLVSSVSKKLKTENGKEDRKSNWRSFFKTKETRKSKGDGRYGSKIALKPSSYVKDIKQKKERKSSVTKNTFKGSKKENEKTSARRNIKSQTIASKRLKTEKTIKVVNIKETKQKKREVLRRRNIFMTKNNVKSESISDVKNNLSHSFKAPKKENGMHLSSIDKSYEYFFAYLRNTITIFEPNQKVKPVEDVVVCLSDPDVIAISDYPFSVDGICPFEANKGGKVLDLEDDTDETEDIFNSSFNKKLMTILKKPYDKNEFLQLCHEASLKRNVTRTRQLRDGREIEYKVDNEWRPSYLEQHPDFNKKFHRCRDGKDPSRALSLLRGFHFYLKHTVHEGAFKPWMYEERLKIECEDNTASISLLT